MDLGPKPEPPVTSDHLQWLLIMTHLCEPVVCIYAVFITLFLFRLFIGNINILDKPQLLDFLSSSLQQVFLSWLISNKEDKWTTSFSLFQVSHN